MKPELLLIQQIKTTAEIVEQNIKCLYDPQVSYEQKKVAMSYLYIQTRQIKELTGGLFTQYRRIEDSL